jgi:hypothetical protein
MRVSPARLIRPNPYGMNGQGGHKSRPYLARTFGFGGHPQQKSPQHFAKGYQL